MAAGGNDPCPWGYLRGLLYNMLSVFISIIMCLCDPLSSTNKFNQTIILSFEVHGMHTCPSHSGLWAGRKRFVGVMILREFGVLTQPLSSFQDNLALRVVPSVC